MESAIIVTKFLLDNLSIELGVPEHWLLKKVTKGKKEFVILIFQT